MRDPVENDVRVRRRAPGHAHRRPARHDAGRCTTRPPTMSGRDDLRREPVAAAMPAVRATRPAARPCFARLAWRVPIGVLYGRLTANSDTPGQHRPKPVFEIERVADDCAGVPPVTVGRLVPAGCGA